MLYTIYASKNVVVQSLILVLDSEMAEKSMFDIKVLEGLNFEDLEGINFNPSITQKDPGENLRMRPLHRDDYSRGKLFVQFV